jgi:hypothetical protein
MAAELSAVRGTDALVDALAARRAAGSGDPAVRMLWALIKDVDELVPARQGPAEHVAAEEIQADEDRPAPPSGPRRRGPRTIVALGVAGAVLAGTGVAAAGGGMPGRSAPQATGPAEEARHTGPEASEAGKAAAPRAQAPVRAEPSARPVQGRTGPGEPDQEPRRVPVTRIKHRIPDDDEQRPRVHLRGGDGRTVRPQTDRPSRTQRSWGDLRRRSQDRLGLPRDLDDRF